MGVKALNQRLLLLPLILWTMLLFGCESDLPGPDISRTKSYYSLEDLSSDGLDPLFTDALLTFDGAALYNDLHTRNFVSSIAAKAMFTNDSASEEVGFVSVNNTPLFKAAPGQYLPTDLDYPQPYRAHWVVTGYEGSSVDDLSTDLRELRFLGFNAGDSVSKSVGFIVNYTGSGGGDLIVTVYFDKGITYIFGDSMLAYSGTGSLEKTSIDNGSVSINPTELAGFTHGGYISVTIENWEYHQLTIKSGRRIGIKNRYLASIPLFLKGS